MKNTRPKLCAMCGKPLVIRRFNCGQMESPRMFEKRKYCSTTCSAKGSIKHKNTVVRGEEKKVCSKCSIEKPIKAFRIDKNRLKPRSICRSCDTKSVVEWRKRNPEKVKQYDKKRHKERDWWESHLNYEYGIGSKEYRELFLRQKGRCAICGTTNPKSRHHRFNVDHCHETGMIRGLLCWECNAALGKFRDDPILLLAALRYLLNAKRT